MKKTLLALLAALFMVLPVAADDPVAVESHILAVAWDLDGEGADTDQVVAAAQIVDGKDDYTIAANPDTCRLVEITLTDGDSSITAGTFTVTGTDCWGDPLVTTYTADGSGSGTYTLTVSSGQASGAYYETVTQLENGTMTGEGGAADTVEVGYGTDTTPAQYAMYGRRMQRFSAIDTGIGTNSPRWIALNGRYTPGPRDQLVTTSGSASTTLAAVDSTNDDPFQNVAVGDILFLTQDGYEVERKVTARASADSITLNASVNIAAAGQTFEYTKFWVFSDPQDGWFSVEGWDAVFVILDVDVNANTGGVVSDVACAVLGPTYEPLVQVDTDTVASGSAGTAVTSVDLRLAPAYTHCRVGLEFGTNDDADAAAEDINLAVGFRR